MPIVQWAWAGLAPTGMVSLHNFFKMVFVLLPWKNQLVSCVKLQYLDVLIKNCWEIIIEPLLNFIL